MLGDLLGYLAVFVAAAIPWVELVVVIPPAIAFGLNPVAVGVLAFIGNALPVAGIVAAERHVARWWRAGAMALDRAWVDATGRDDRISRFVLPGFAPEEPSAEGAPERKRGWRDRLTSGAVHRYGVPGLAIVAPLTTGIHLATLIALGFRAPKPAVLWWMVASLAAWSAAVTILTALGVGLFR